MFSEGSCSGYSSLDVSDEEESKDDVKRDDTLLLGEQQDKSDKEMKVGKKMLEAGKQRMTYAIQKVTLIDSQVSQVNTVIRNLANAFTAFSTDLTTSCEALFDRQKTIKTSVQLEENEDVSEPHKLL